MARHPEDNIVLATAVVGWLQAHPEGASLHDLAATFDVSEGTLESIVTFLWTIGVPDDDGFVDTGSMYDFDPFALEAPEPWVRLTHAPVDRVAPLRLRPDEVATMFVALDHLREIVPDTGAVDSVMEKLTSIFEDASPRRTRIPHDADTAGEGDDETLDVVFEALRSHRRLHLRYRSDGSAEPTERDVDPIRIETLGLTYYLRAWCHLRGDFRWFRHDRILSARVLDAVADHHEDAAEPLFRPTDAMPSVTLEVRDDRITAVAPYVDAFQPDTTAPSGSAAAEGWRRIDVRFGSTRALYRLVAGNADAIRVVAPRSAREAIAAMASSALAGLAEPRPGVEHPVD